MESPSPIFSMVRNIVVFPRTLELPSRCPRAIFSTVGFRSFPAKELRSRNSKLWLAKSFEGITEKDRGSKWRDEPLYHFSKAATRLMYAL